MTALAPTTAPASLRNRPAVRSGKIVSRDRGPVRPALRTRPFPASPVPVPPAAPPARGRHVASPVRQRGLAPVESKREAVRPRALRPGWVARLVATATVTLAVVGGLSWLGPGATPRIPADTEVTRVGAGETVWDVARRVAPQFDQRAVVGRIRQLNGIVDAAVAPGQQLQVPDGR